MAVADAKGRKLDAVTGIAFVVLALIGFLVPGTPPKADDTIQKIQTFISDHHSDLLTSSLLLALAVVLLLWWLGALRSYLRSGEGGEGRLSAAAFGGGIVGGVFILAGAALQNGLAFKLGETGASPDLVRAFFDASSAAFAMAGFGFAVLFGAASCSGARSGALPSWAYWSAAVVAVIQLLGGLALVVKSGFLETGGAMAFIAPLVAMVWVVAASVVMIRRAGVPPVPRTEP